jgi:hypothetical protein
MKMSRRELLAAGLGATVAAAMIFGGGQVAEYIKSQEAEHNETHVTAPWLPETVIHWRDKIEQYSKRYGIDANLLAIMMTVESGGNPHADSGVAKGLLQITDPTAKDIAEKHLHAKRGTYDLYDPDTSIEFGAAYVRYLADTLNISASTPTDDMVVRIAAGYNGGFKAVEAYDKDHWKGLDEYAAQTRFYARYVHVMWGERGDPNSFAYREWYGEDGGNGKRLVDQAQAYLAEHSH